MPRFGRRRMGLGSIIDSMKNTKTWAVGTTGGSQTILLAKAKDSPVTTNDTDVKRGSVIKAMYLICDGCGLGGTGVLNNMDFYLWKNVGANLSPPSPVAVGTSNEKRFVFRQWHFMIMRNQDGNLPFHWEGWIRIPRKYQRMATDDTIDLVILNTAALTGHFSGLIIYKWYS